MSVIRSELMLNSRNGSSDEKFQRSYVAKWLITTNNKLDGPQVVYTQAGSASPDPVPAKFASYAVGNDVDANAYHLDNSIEPHNAGTELQWVVTVNFGPAPKGEAPGERNPNPLERPPRYSAEWGNYSRPLVKDINGNLIVNAAKQPFDPPPVEEDARPILVVKKNVSSLAEVVSLMLTYKNAVNSDSFYGAGVREAKIESIQAGDQIHENGYSYYEITIRIMFNEAGEKFDRLFVNHGHKYFEGTGADKKLVIANVKGVPMSEAALLTKDGYKLPDDKDGNSIPFRTSREVAFSGLGV